MISPAPGSGVCNRLYADRGGLSRSRRQPRDHQTQALASARDLPAPVEEARALEGLGHSHIRDGNRSDGIAQLRQALAIFHRVGAPDAPRVQDILRDHSWQHHLIQPQR